jgi:hypothetical protein
MADNYLDYLLNFSYDKNRGHFLGGEMAKSEIDYHNLFCQLPRLLWNKLADEADKEQETITGMLSKILLERYPDTYGPDSPLPKRRRPGRPPQRN